MAATGTIEIDGKKYAWTSPTLADLEEFENQVGPIVDMKAVNSIRGRAYLAFLCLREKQPNITLGVIRSWPAEVYNEVWPAIVKAIPLWIVGSPDAKPRASSNGSAPASSSQQDGPHPERGESA